MKNVILVIVGIALVGGLASWYRQRSVGDQATETPRVSVSASPAATGFVSPIADAGLRVTAKPFGLYVSPTHSPVIPERFTGYHTGVDFETFPNEKDVDVPILAVCTGPLQEKTTASGYGGVVVQSCTLNGQPITVVYGHLKLTSVSALVGGQVVAGQTLGVLGKGYSSETDGERKHLHLGIHRGTDINIRGYTQTSDELSEWINIADYLRA